MGLWSDIRNVWGNFSYFISFKLGDGSRICFWHGVWREEAALKTIFLDIYSIACDKEPWYWITWIPSAYLSIGICVLQGQFRIESCNLQTRSSICYTPRELIWGRRIECCGLHLVIIALKCRTIIKLYRLEIFVLSPGKVFGRLRFRLTSFLHMDDNFE
jgi:hypothetical protein